MKFLYLFFILFFAIRLHAEPEALIEAAISSALSAEQVPVVFIDLDATLFSESGRLRKMLEWYDEASRTSLFKKADWSRFNSFSGFNQSVADHLAALPIPEARKKVLLSEILQFERQHRFDERAILNDEIFLPLKIKLLEWQQRGVEVVFISGRDTTVRAYTLKRLEREGLVRFTLLTKSPGEKNPIFKTTRIGTYLDENSKRRAIALLDDEIETLKAVHLKFPYLIAGHVAQQQTSFLQLVQDLLESCGPLDRVGAAFPPQK